MSDDDDDVVTEGPETFPIVAIGASAGGLDAFRQFLEAMPADGGMAFLLIQHLDPNHESLMAELLERHSEMPVLTAETNTPIAPNTVYVIPSNCYLRVVDLTIFLDRPVTQRGVRMPIDYCFRSLAETLHERAVGVVLTGTASDGTAGLREIKATGGLTLVQDPETAAYDGMPRSAIKAGVADFVTPIAEMPTLLLRYGGHPFIVGTGKHGPGERGGTHRLPGLAAAVAQPGGSRLQRLSSGDAESAHPPTHGAGAGRHDAGIPWNGCGATTTR